MSHNFLLSSPSRLDPQLFAPTPSAKGNDLAPSHPSGNPPLGKFMPTPSANVSNNHNNPGLFPGWTPVMSKTIDQYPNLNITPNRFGNSMGMNLNANNASVAPGGLNQVPPSGSSNSHFLGSMGQYQNPGEMVDLSLTPFLNQYNQQQLQLQLQYSNSHSNMGSMGVTPFQDKSYQLTDFFMDSPIADQNVHPGQNGHHVIISTPFKDQLEGITPSKFRMGTSLIPNSVAKLLDFSHSKKSRASIVEISEDDGKFKKTTNKQKRSISEVDTPPRQAHKLLSNLKEEDKENINALTDKRSLGGNKDDEDDNEEDDDDDDDDDFDKNNSFLQTPSKKYIPRNRVARTPKNSTNANGVTVLMTGNVHPVINSFQTPKGKTTLQLSSPSTIVVNSSAKTSPAGFSSTPLQKAKSTTATTALNVSVSPADRQSPMMKSVEEIGIPMMGVFQESKKKTVPNKPKRKGGVNKFQIIFTDVHTLMNSKNPPHIMNNKRPTNIANTSTTSDSSGGFRAASPNASNKKGDKKKNKRNVNQSSFPLSGSLMVMQPQTSGQLSHLSPQMPNISLHNNNLMTHNADQTINTSKEISILSNANTSNINLTDHTSFDMNSLVSSIGYPNSGQPQGNFLTASPNTLKYIQQQVLQPQHQILYQPQMLVHQPNMQQAVMPPPKNVHHQPPHPQLQQGVHPMDSTNMNGSMIMSTPQHSHIMNYPNYSPQKWD